MNRNTGLKLESEKQKETLKRDLDKLKSEGYGNTEEAKSIEDKLNHLNKIEKNETTASPNTPNTISNDIYFNHDENLHNEWKYGRISLEEVTETLN